MQKNSQQKQDPPKAKAGNKLTIRRKGGCLPALCLVVLLLLAVVFGWLTHVGLPDWGLRYIEGQAEAEGYHIHIDRAKLCPAAGLAVQVDGISLYTSKGDTRPLAVLDSAYAEFTWSGIFTGDLAPRRATTTGLKVEFPVSGKEGGFLTILSPNFTIQTRGRYILIDEGDVEVQGVSIHISGVIQKEGPKPSTGGGGGAPSEPQDFADTLAEYQPYIDRIHHEIERQQWQNGEFPDFDIIARVKDGTQEYSAALILPRLDLDPYRFRDGDARLTYKEDGTIIVDQLRINTIEPDTLLQTRGSYNLETRTVNFTLRSNAPLLHMVQRFAKDNAGPVLSKLKHDEKDTLEVRLGGDIQLTEDYQPEDIRVRCGILQKNLLIGNSRVDCAEIAFTFNNGDLVLEKCKVVLPGGSLSLRAKSISGDGDAEFNADVDVAALLGLVNEFTESPVLLPEGLALQGRTKLTLKADLDTPDFKTDSFEWLDYVPDVEGVTLTAQVDGVDYNGYVLGAPSLELKLGGIHQDDQDIPDRIGRADLHVHLGSATIPTGEGEAPVTVSQADLHWHGSGIELLDLLEKSPDVIVQSMGATLAAAGVDNGEYRVEDISLTLDGVDGLHPLDARTPLPENAGLELTAKSILHEGAPLGRVRLAASYSGQKPTQAGVDLTVTPQGAETSLHLTATPDWADTDKPALRDIDLHEQDLTVLAPLLEHFDAKVEDIRLPDSLTLHGTLLWDAKESRVYGGEFTLNVPELVRTPTQVPQLIGKEVAVSVDTKVYLFTTEEGGLAYDADVKVYHETGMLDAHVQGCGPKVDVTGTNSVRADIIDILVDDKDAHLIIRDFKFGPDCRTKVTDIHTQVDLSGPGRSRRVKSYCWADIEGLSYMLNIMEDKPDGSEGPRLVNGEAPYTHAKHVSCSVTVDLAFSCVDENGDPIPDECTITMGNATIDYDNAPWLKRSKFKTGELNTRLTGDKIIIDTEKEFVQIENIRGRVYAAYSIGMFYPDLQDFMEDVIMPSPASLHTDKCVFP